MISSHNYPRSVSRWCLTAQLAKTALMLVKRLGVLLIRELITEKIINIPVIRKSEKRKHWII